MRTTLRLAVALAAAVLIPAAAAQAAAPSYYLSLGDSLAVGVQPNAAGLSVETNDGYVDQLFGFERRRHRGLVLAKLGCGGETTTTMMRGGKCQYQGDHRLRYSGRRRGNQLAAAETFLREHRGHIAFVTLDIGANDVDSCLKNGQIDGNCLNAGIASIKRNIPIIVRAVRRAAGRSTRIVGMTYYNPFFALYLESSTRGLATASLPLARQVNDSVASSFRSNGVSRVADVASAFKTYDMTTQASFAGLTVPLNVARICTLTWMCVSRPVGPNVHANIVGYEVMARTFVPLV